MASNRYFQLRFIVEMKADEQKIISIADKLNASVYRVLYDAKLYPRRQVLSASAFDEIRRAELDKLCDSIWMETISKEKI